MLASCQRLRRSKGRALLAVAAWSVWGALLGSASCAQPHDEDEAPRTPINGCIRCHGSADRPGTALARAAPPLDIDGNTDPSLPSVGAHQIHLTATATHGPVACEQCHLVPSSAQSPEHADTGRPAEFTAGRVARLGGVDPAYDGETHTCSATYCHRSADPVWIAPRLPADICGSCHTLPPPLPHEQSTDCQDCHGAVIGPGFAFIDASRHVNGGVDIVGECYDCHGTPGSFAPPPDLAGQTETTSIGVGAHQAHLSGGASSRPLECGSCHEVPAEVGAVGHIDPGVGAEVVFGGVAVTAARRPSWDRDDRSCTNSWCHGPSSTDDSATPAWTRAPGNPLSCGSCHDLPPPEPHPQADDCTSCHGSVVSGPPGDVVVHTRDLHVNGRIDP